MLVHLHLVLVQSVFSFTVANRVNILFYFSKVIWDNSDQTRRKDLLPFFFFKAHFKAMFPWF